MIDILRDNWLLLLIGQYPHGPLGGLTMTLLISAACLLLTVPISIAMALTMTSSIRWVRLPVMAFVQVMRGIPFLMLLFWVYFALPLLLNIDFAATYTLIIALTFYKSAYVAEIIRGGMVALPKGQMEAAHALGLSYRTRTFKIVLPQVIYNTLPSMVTQFVGIVKDTSVGYIITAPDLMFAAGQLNATLMTQPFEVFAIVAAAYFIINFALTSFSKYLERRMNRERSVPAAPSVPANPPVLPQKASA